MPVLVRVMCDSRFLWALGLGFIKGVVGCVKKDRKT